MSTEITIPNYGIASLNPDNVIDGEVKVILGGQNPNNSNAYCVLKISKYSDREININIVRREDKAASRLIIKGNGLRIKDIRYNHTLMSSTIKVDVIFYDITAVLSGAATGVNVIFIKSFALLNPDSDVKIGRAIGSMIISGKHVELGGYENITFLWNYVFANYILVKENAVIRNNIINFVYNNPIFEMGNTIKTKVITDNLFIPWIVYQNGLTDIVELGNEDYVIIKFVDEDSLTSDYVMFSNNVIVCNDGSKLKCRLRNDSTCTLSDCDTIYPTFKFGELVEDYDLILCVKKSHLYRMRHVYTSMITHNLSNRIVLGTNHFVKCFCEMYFFDAENREYRKYYGLMINDTYFFCIAGGLDPRFLEVGKYFSIKLPFYNNLFNYTKKTENQQKYLEVNHEGKLPNLSIDNLYRIGVAYVHLLTSSIKTNTMNYERVSLNELQVDITNISQEERDKLEKLMHIHFKYAYINNTYYEITEMSINNTENVLTIKINNPLGIGYNGELQIHEAVVRVVWIDKNLISEIEIVGNYAKIYVDLNNTMWDVITNNGYVILAISDENPEELGIYDTVNRLTYPGIIDMVATYAGFKDYINRIAGTNLIETSIENKELTPYQLIGIQGDVEIINNQAKPTDYPTPESVRENVSYGGGMYVGTVRVPEEKDVLYGVQYDADILPKTGKFKVFKYQEELEIREL